MTLPHPRFWRLGAVLTLATLAIAPLPLAARPAAGQGAKAAPASTAPTTGVPAQAADVMRAIRLKDTAQMAVSEEDGRFLRVLTASQGARRVLEIGASRGYSAIWIGLGLRDTGGQLVTIEYDPALAREATANLATAGLSDIVRVVSGDAFAEIPKLGGTFDSRVSRCLEAGLQEVLRPGAAPARQGRPLCRPQRAEQEGGDGRLPLRHLHATRRVVDHRRAVGRRHLAHLQAAMTSRTVHLHGVPLDLGGGRRGVDMGPSAVRIAGLSERLSRMGHTVIDRGDIPAPIPETRVARDPKKKYIREIARVCQKLYHSVQQSLVEGALPIVIGGDHSVAAGSVGAAADMAHAQGRPIGLLWIDAHGDMNTPATTQSGNVHGMPLAALVGTEPAELAAIGGRSPKLLASKTVLIGIRDLDELEKQRIRDSGIEIFTMKDIDRHGIAVVMKRALAIAGDDTLGIHVSFDLDVCDPTIAPGVGTPVKGGLDYREAHLAMEMIADSGQLLGLDLVEVNPILDIQNQTAVLAAELAQSALGLKIILDDRRAQGATVTITRWYRVRRGVPWSVTARMMCIVPFRQHTRLVGTVNQAWAGRSSGSPSGWPDAGAGDLANVPASW